MEMSFTVFNMYLQYKAESQKQAGPDPAQLTGQCEELKARVSHLKEELASSRQDHSRSSAELHELKLKLSEAENQKVTLELDVAALKEVDKRNEKLKVENETLTKKTQEQEKLVGAGVELGTESGHSSIYFLDAGGCWLHLVNHGIMWQKLEKRLDSTPTPSGQECLLFLYGALWSFQLPFCRNSLRGGYCMCPAPPANESILWYTFYKYIIFTGFHHPTHSKKWYGKEETERTYPFV